MKIRTGFVSNSSSTSFCIYGICMDEDEIRNSIVNTENMTEEDVVRLAKLKLNDDIEDDGDIYEILEMLTNKYNLSFHISEENECYIGRDFTSIKDDETGKEFKDSTVNILKAIFGDKIEASIFEEVIYG